MDWLRGDAEQYEWISGLVYAVWGIVFLLMRVRSPRGGRRLVPWGVSLLVLSLGAAMHLLAGLSVPLACAALWLVQSSGVTLLLYGLLPEAPDRRADNRRWITSWATLTAVALAGLVAAAAAGAVHAWLASMFMLQTASLLVGAAVAVWRGRYARAVPLWIALLFFAGYSLYQSLAQLGVGSGGGYGLLEMLTAILLCNAMSWMLFVEESTRAIAAAAEAEALARKLADDAVVREQELNELIEKRHRLDLVMKASDVHEYDKEGGVLHSESWFVALGYPFQTIGEQEFEQYVHLQDQPAYLQGRAIAEQSRGQTFTAEVRIRKADGNYVWYYVSSRDVTLHNKAVTLGMAVNIDLHKRTERHLMQSDKLAAVGQLASGVAHDISNHLMTIQTSLGMITTVTDEVQRRKFASYMQEAVANSTGMLKRLINFSKGDEGDFAKVAMNSLVSQSKELLERALYREASITLAEGAERETVTGNYYELQNAILNIGLNARDALPEKGGSIELRTWNADQNPLKPGTAGWYYIAIRDNGCGMSDETQKRIFDPFFTTKPQGKGSGLGLFTTFGNLRRHGGTISVESTLGGGSEFVIAIPLAEELADSDSQLSAGEMI